MKKIIGVLAIGLLLISCQTEDITENTEVSVENLFLQTPKASFDTSEKGIYHGVFSTFDSKLHGEIIINVGNDGNYNAGVKLLNGEKLTFEATNKDFPNLHFEGERGSFSISLNDKPIDIKLEIDNKKGYIYAYKETRGAGVTIALGSYIDDSDPTFSGNWDMINLGRIDPVNPFGALTIEDIVVSHIGGQVFTDETIGVLEPSTGCVFAGDSGYMLQLAADLIILDGKDQIVTINGIECVWTMFYGVNGATITYQDITCSVVAAGTWSRNGRTGSITVLSAGTL